MKTLHEILTLIRNNQAMFGQFKYNRGTISGICDIADELYLTEKLTKDEINEFQNFMYENRPNDSDLYWWDKEDNERWIWLDEQIRKTEPIKI